MATASLRYHDLSLKPSSRRRNSAKTGRQKFAPDSPLIPETRNLIGQLQIREDAFSQALARINVEDLAQSAESLRKPSRES